MYYAKERRPNRSSRQVRLYRWGNYRCPHVMSKFRCALESIMTPILLTSPGRANLSAKNSIRPTICAIPGVLLNITKDHRSIRFV